jgi:hypothetical protein
MTTFPNSPRLLNRGIMVIDPQIEPRVTLQPRPDHGSDQT